MVFVVYRDRQGGYRWQLRSSNGKAMAESVGPSYSSEQKCRAPVERVRQGCPTAVVKVIG